MLRIIFVNNTNKCSPSREHLWREKTYTVLKSSGSWISTFYSIVDKLHIQKVLTEDQTVRKWIYSYNRTDVN